MDLDKTAYRYATVPPGHPSYGIKAFTSEHIIVAEFALGKPLPKGAVVHHVNGIPGDNRRENLVICENTSYHMLLHQRENVLAAGGDPDTQKLCRCGRLREINGRCTHGGERFIAPVSKDPFRNKYNHPSKNKRIETTERVELNRLWGRGQQAVEEAGCVPEYRVQLSAAEFNMVFPEKLFSEMFTLPDLELMTASERFRSWRVGRMKRNAKEVSA